MQRAISWGSEMITRSGGQDRGRSREEMWVVGGLLEICCQAVRLKEGRGVACSHTAKIRWGVARSSKTQYLQSRDIISRKDRRRDPSRMRYDGRCSSERGCCRSNKGCRCCAWHAVISARLFRLQCPCTSRSTSGSTPHITLFPSPYIASFDSRLLSIVESRALSWWGPRVVMFKGCL
jgi:hypothetical protein